MKSAMFKKAYLKGLVNNFLERRKKTCPKCGQEALVQTWSTMRCSWQFCRHKFSICEETFFHRIKVKPWKVFRILDLWLKNMPVGLIQYVVRRVLRNLESLLPKYYKKLGKIGSFNTIVEIDESKFGKRKYNKGHHVEGVWVLGMVERSEARRIVLMAVDDRTKNTLTEKIRNSVNPESTIYTDCWKSYNGLGEIFDCHETVNHSLHFVDPSTAVHTNTIEGTWFAVKSTTPNRKRTKVDINLHLFRFMLVRNSVDNPLNELINLL